jgi:hypothetical protein
MQYPKFNDVIYYGFALLFAFQLLAKKNYSQLSWENEGRFII